MENAAPIGRVYQMSWLFRGFALAFLIFGFLLFVTFLRGILTGEADPNITKTMIAIVLPIVGLFTAAHAFVSRVVFTNDALQRVTLIGRRTVPLNLIRGRREYVVNGDDPPGSTRYVRLELNNGDKSIDLGKKLYNFDHQFWAWYNSLPDLDAADKVPHKDSGFGLV